MSRGFIHTQSGNTPIVVPDLGTFLVSTNGSTMATDKIVVEFWAEGAEQPQRGHVSFKPQIDIWGHLDLGAPHAYNLTGIGGRWPRAAFDYASTLASAVQVHDPVGTLWMLKDLCFYGMLNHRRALQEAQRTVESFTKMLADPLQPQTERYRCRETDDFLDRPLSDAERESRRLGWAIVLKRACKTVRELQSPAELRRVQRMQMTMDLLRSRYFNTPRRKMPPREIAQVALNMLEGAE